MAPTSSTCMQTHAGQQVERRGAFAARAPAGAGGRRQRAGARVLLARADAAAAGARGRWPGAGPAGGGGLARAGGGGLAQGSLDARGRRGGPCSRAYAQQAGAAERAVGLAPRACSRACAAAGVVSRGR
ncbi:hypothetical protein Taro_024504 [Colocasia esculenta]|uniref:Uncharacterized protein n=1 Tax=Colocasia esculenta TaxID=4460 RepID=A0A843V6Z3_COLES|nr:hypothetical protein [Colocasia esculenta]